jgi:methylamine dehydrogenase accessory protein MauD
MLKERASEHKDMNTILVISSVLLWLAVLGLAFLTLGTLKAMTFLRWQLEQLQATTPSRKGRSGLKVGKKAPPFTLPGVAGSEVSLASYAGRQVFLVFVQTGCGPCHAVAPDLNRLQQSRKYQVLVVNNGEAKAVEKWAAEVHAEFPVLIQDKWSVSKRYEVFATPFAFLIDEQGVIASKGFVSNKQYLGFVLERRSAEAKSEPGEADAGEAAVGESEESPSLSYSKEVQHV